MSEETFEVSPVAPGSQAEPSGSSRLSSPAYLRLLAIQLSFGLSYSAFLLLPKYLKVEFSASAEDIGWVSGTAVIAAAVLAPFIGVSAQWVSQRWLIASSLLLAGISGVTFVLAGGIGPWLYVLRVLQGVAWIIVFNCTATMAADLVPKERLSEAIGYLGVSMLVTNALAPAVVEPVAIHFGWALAFGAPAVCSLCAIVLVAKLPAGVSAREPREQERSSLRPSVLPIHYASLLMGAGIGVMFTFTQPFALSLGASRVGDFFFGYVAAALFVRVALTRVTDRVGPARVATAAMVLYAIVVSGTAYLRPELLVVIGLGLGTCHGLLYPALMATGLADLSKGERSMFMGWTSFAFNGGFAVTVLGLGPVADRLGYPILFWTVGALLSTGILPLGVSRGVLFTKRPAFDKSV